MLEDAISSPQVPAETLPSPGSSDVASLRTGKDENLEPHSSRDLEKQSAGGEEGCSPSEGFAGDGGDSGVGRTRDSNENGSDGGKGSKLSLGLREGSAASAACDRPPKASGGGVGGERSSSPRRSSSGSGPLETVVPRQQPENGVSLSSPSPVASSKGGKKRQHGAANGGERGTRKSRDEAITKRGTTDGNSSSSGSSSTSSSSSSSDWSGSDSDAEKAKTGLSDAPLKCEVGEFVVFPTPRDSPVPFLLGKILRKQASAAARPGGPAGTEVVVHWFTPKKRVAPAKGAAGATDIEGVGKGAVSHRVDEESLSRRKVDTKEGFASAPQSAEAAAAAAVEAATEAAAAVTSYTAGSKWSGVFVPDPAGGKGVVSDTGVENLAAAVLVFPELLPSNAGMSASVRNAVSDAVVAAAVAAELQGKRSVAEMATGAGAEMAAGAEVAAGAGAGGPEGAGGVEGNAGKWDYDSADDFE